MNHIYRLIWNSALNLWQVAAETARGSGKTERTRRSRRKAMLVGLLGTPFVHAVELPQGGAITAGAGSIGQNGNHLTITQNSHKLAIDWQGFSIGEGGQVSFVQPGANAVALNRVLGQDPSRILGTLSANGQVFLLNPNGILFGGSARVDVGGLVASTLDLANDDFLAGRYRFTGGGVRGSVVNQGGIAIGEGGYIALLAPEVSNQGTIRATLGTALLGAGDQITLQLDGPNLVGYSVDKGTLRALAENRQLIEADGGRVVLTAKAADALSQAVVNNTGVVQARRIAERGGTILLLGDMDVGVTQVAGTLDASAPTGGDGGFIETSAARVKVADEVRITTAAPYGTNGTWLVDPNDFVIGGDIGGATLSTQLNAGNVTIQSAQGGSAGNGDIFVNDTVNWSANTLTLSAHRNIEINRVLNGSGTAKLALEYGQGTSDGVIDGVSADYIVRASVNLPAGQNFSTKLGGGFSPTFTYTVITALGIAGSTSGTDLQGINGDLNGRYVLGADIDASATSSWAEGAGFTPLGSSSSLFRGQFHGLGHTIKGLTIRRPDTDYVGLFGSTIGLTTLRDLGLINTTVIGRSYVGGLAGLSQGRVLNSYVKGGSIQSNNADFLGGMVGLNSGAISNSYAEISVSGNSDDVGGLVGNNSGTIDNSYTTQSTPVTGKRNVGGLVGNSNGTINGSYSNTTTRAIDSDDSASKAIGGLVGKNSGNINNSYSGTGFVTGYDVVGGLVGENQGTISNSYSRQKARANGGNVGGLVGLATGGNVTGSFWDIEASGVARSAGGIGLSTHEMNQSWPYLNAGWSMYGPNKVWARNPSRNNGYPELCAFFSGCITALTIDLPNGSSSTYGTEPQLSAAFVIANALEEGKLSSATLAKMGISISGSASLWISQNYQFVGAHSPAGIYNNMGYMGGLVISGVNAANFVLYEGRKSDWRINPAPLVVTAGNASKVYDSQGWNGGAGVSYSGFVNGENASVLNGSLFFGGGSQGAKDAGTYSITANGLNAANYNLIYKDGTLTISPRPLNLTASRLYDGTANIAANLFTLGNLVGSDTLTLTGSATAADKNAGNGKAVNTSGLTLGSGSGKALNYTLVGGSHTATITPVPLTVTAQNATKTYDGLAWSGGNSVTYSGFVAGENSGVLGGSLTFTGTSQGAKDAGNYVLAPRGMTSSNYTITFQNGMLAITPRVVNILGSRTYDGTSDFAATFLTLGNLAGTETLTLTGTATVADKNVGSGKTLNTGSLSLGNGSGKASNYTFVGGSHMAAITPAPLTVVGASAASKVYDGTNLTTISGATLSGTLYGGDSVTLALTTIGSFTDKNVGIGKQVTVAATLSGTHAANYTFVQPANLIADITPAPLSIVGASAASKIYDGTRQATISGATLSGTIYGSDSVSLANASSGSFADKNAGIGKPVTLDALLNGADAANYALAPPSGITADISPAPLVVTASDATKTYDSLAWSGGNGVTYSGFVNGENAGVLTGSPSYGGNSQGAKNAGGYVLTPGGLSSDNYAITYRNGTLTIVPRIVNLAASRIYDGAADVAVGLLGFNNLVAGETLELSGSASTTDKNAGNDKAVNAGGLTLRDGSGLASNYTLAGGMHTVTITPAALTLSAVADSRTYNGGTASTGQVAVSGLYAGDTLHHVSQSFDSKNAGTRQLQVDGGYVLDDGNGGQNYTVMTQTATGAITPAQLAVSGASALNKGYDGTVVATISGAALSGTVFGSDEVRLTNARLGQFADKNAGTGKSVAMSAGLAGADAGNYVLAQQAGLTADITPAALAVTGASAQNKIYDGTVAAAISGATLSGTVFGSDEVRLTNAMQGTFADKNAGTGKSVAMSAGLAGADAGNYVLAQQAGLTADITPAALAVTGASALNKTYDGTVAATISGAALSGTVFGSDEVRLTNAMQGTFADKNAGIGKSVAMSAGLAGADAGNYVLAQQAALTADITPAALAVTGASALNKIYDGTVTAAISGAALSGTVFGSDEVRLTNASLGQFADKNAGTGKSVAMTAGLAGADAGNYVLAQQAGLTADITPAALAVTGASALNKTYDGTVAATISGAALNGTVFGSDEVRLTNAMQGTFADKNAGIGKSVAMTAGLAGADAGNYVLAQQAGLTADITPAALAVTGASALNKTYDGTVAATISGAALNGTVFGSDEVRLTNAMQGTFADKNAGIGKSVAMTAGLAGADAGNYVLAQQAGLTADITPAALAVTGASAQNKTYDGTVAAAISGAVLSGTVFDSDEVRLTNAMQGTFADKNAGTGKSVAMTAGLAGADAGNYVLAQQAGLTADITPAPLTLSAVTDSRMYNGGTASAGQVAVSGLHAGDGIRNLVQRFDGSAVGNRVLTVADGYLIEDGNGGDNYLVSRQTADGRITPNLTQEGVLASILATPPHAQPERAAPVVSAGAPTPATAVRPPAPLWRMETAVPRRDGNAGNLEHDALRLPPDYRSSVSALGEEGERRLASAAAGESGAH